MESTEIKKASMNPLKSKRQLKKLAAELTDSAIETAATHLMTILEERAIEAAEIEKQEAERQEKIKQLSEMMKSLNLSSEDLLSMDFKSSTKRSSVTPKYRLIDSEGQEHVWAGRGRPPAAFIEVKENGTLEDYLIEKEEQA